MRRGVGGLVMCRGGWGRGDIYLRGLSAPASPASDGPKDSKARRLWARRSLRAARRRRTPEPRADEMIVDEMLQA